MLRFFCAPDGCMFFATCTVARRLSERFPLSPLGWHARRARWWDTDPCTSRLSCSPRTSRPSRSSLIPVPGVGPDLADRQGRSGWRALRCRPLSHPPPLGIEPCGRAAPCPWRPHHRLHLGSHPFVRRCCSLLRGPTAARTDARRLWLDHVRRGLVFLGVPQFQAPTLCSMLSNPPRGS